jgi:two-component system OmpR family sensor kinase
MRSLRARLIAGLLVLATAGLVALAAITYAEQRSFLFDQTDGQARAAVEPVDHALGGQHRDDLAPSGERGGRDFGLPAGVYGERRTPSGRVLASRVLDFRGVVTARPSLPAHMRLGEAITVPGRKGADTRYRALAVPGRDGTVTVVAVPLRSVDETLQRLLIVEALVIGAVLLALAALAWVLVRVGLRPLERIAQTADAIAGGDLSHRVADPDARTEPGRLGMAFNAMLDRLTEAFAERQASEDRLRDFLADASHELRTPLVSIRGYAELFRMGATADPEELAKAMRRIEDEAARMGVLVEDLLALARLDEVRDAPHGPVDLAPLVRDAADDARAAAPDRAVDVDAVSPLVVEGQPDQLRQVLANLVRNALVHTPAGTPIELSARRENGSVRLDVRDHGPGLPTDRPEQLFERLWRSEEGRARGRGGTGLGLAIVAAIVDAHHGSVDAADAPGGGACFTIRLPIPASAPPRIEPDGAPRARRRRFSRDSQVSQGSL